MKNVSVDQVMSLTGLTKRQVFRLTRERRIPAAIISGRFVMTPHQLETLNREGVAPPTATAENPLMPTNFIRKRAS